VGIPREGANIRVARVKIQTGQSWFLGEQMGISSQLVSVMQIKVCRVDLLSERTSSQVVHTSPLAERAKTSGTLTKVPSKSHQGLFAKRRLTTVGFVRCRLYAGWGRRWVDEQEQEQEQSICGIHGGGESMCIFDNSKGGRGLRKGSSG